MAIRWPLLVRRTHKWLGLVLGVQVLMWTVSGMYMVAIHIDYIHGDHLVRSQAAPPRDLAGLVDPSVIAASEPTAREVKMQTFLDQPVWRVDTKDGPRLYDGVTGAPVPALTRDQAERVAKRIYTGEPTIVSTQLLTTAPIEMQTRKPPYWRVEFEGWNQPTLYISPVTGELISRRHNLWRIFDFAWMLHIMDYSERTDVNNPLLRVATWSAVFMALAGAWLLYWSFPRRKKAKKLV
ncbi:PepSY domain-containing protein [Sphingomonas xanthus]|uniref:PepSY domain-containing protein n=1 Tax=Sphingomonas xanthus TaxID=2594473 RepID=A0A516ISS9_9SPHN|nr:PepSY domain-containing protein [Sphingomonas xanthus]QDP19955.1 hypothetical protein FMM02_08300 [Sphingomonas xanthus]